MKETMRHYLNPAKLRGWLRRHGLSRKWAKKIAMQYEMAYRVVL